MDNATFTSQWSRLEYLITMNEPSGCARVDGICFNGTSSLGLHTDHNGRVVVTHIPSGKQLCAFRTLGAATEFVERIYPLTDWTDVAPVLEESTRIEILKLGHDLFVKEKLPARVAL